MDWIHLSQNRDKCWVLRFHKMQEISGLVKELLAFQQGCPDPMDGFGSYLAAHTSYRHKTTTKMSTSYITFLMSNGCYKQTLLLYKGTQLNCQYISLYDVIWMSSYSTTNEKAYGKKPSQCNLRHNSGSCLQGLRKNTENLSQDNQSPEIWSQKHMNMKQNWYSP